MKSIYSLLLLLALSFAGNATHAQTTDFEVPKNVVLESPADYAIYETEVIAAANWIEETDLDREPQKRKMVNGFLMQWIAGSPDITINLVSPITDLAENNPDLLILYMSGYTRYYLQNKATATPAGGTEAGLRSMLKVYRKDIAINRNKDMEKLSKAEKGGKIKDFMKSYLKTS